MGEAVRYGRVKWFNERRGFGFILGEDDGREYFVHYSQIETGGGYRTLRPDWRVRFVARETERGWAAEQVERL